MVRRARNPFAELLYQARRRAGLTQDDVAEAIAVDKTTVSKWENGHQLATPRLIVRLAGSLGIPEAALWQAHNEAQAQLIEATAEENRTLRRRQKALEAHYEQTLVEMREIVEANRDINEQIGKDIAEIRANFKQMATEARQGRRALEAILRAIESQARPPGA